MGVGMSNRPVSGRSVSGRAAPGPRRDSGLSLVEATIAAALLLVIAGGVLPLFTQALSNNVAGADSSWASNAARSETEELFQLPFNHLELTLTSGTELVTPFYYSLYDHEWKAGTEPAGGVDPALWNRTSTIRQYSVNALEDEVIDPGEALDFDADLGQIHFKEIEVELLGTRTAGPLGPSRRVTVRLLKSQ